MNTHKESRKDKKILDYDENNVWHVYPVNDLKKHTLKGLVCKCNPKIQVQENLAVIVTHKAYDHREWLETIGGERKLGC